VKELERCLTGLSEAHLVAAPAETGAGHRLHRDAYAPFAALAERARLDGFALRVRSSHRTFAAQARIWNDKALGRRTVYDDAGLPMRLDGASPAQLMTAILRWSALPGASRHHWGTDLDVYDGRVEDAGGRVELLPQEAAPGGSCAAFEAWLAKTAADFGFFRPYAEDRGGVAPEWWHLSYAPVAVPWLEALTVGVLDAALREASRETPLCLQELALATLPELHARYVANVAPFMSPRPGV
jgi:LAS superfamily LD-carboxypeptidase LdcB